MVSFDHYLLSGWLSKYFQKLICFGHDTGHLLHTLFGMKGDPHFDIFSYFKQYFLSLAVFFGLHGLAYALSSTKRTQVSYYRALLKKFVIRSMLGFVIIMLAFYCNGQL